VIDAFKPSDNTVQAVHEWLTGSGIHPDRITHSDNKGWFAFYATNKEAENLLHTEFYEYHDSLTGEKLPSCDQYHVPKHLREHIDYVSPGVKLLAIESGHGDLKMKKRTIIHNAESGGSLLHYTASSSPPTPDIESGSGGLPANLKNCDEEITPDCVAALYKLPPTNHSAKPNPNNSMGIFEAEAQYYSQVDLNLFFKNFTPYIPQGTHPAHYDSIDGAPGPTKNLSQAGGEVELDLQLAYPIVYPQTITIFQEDDALYELNPNQTYTFGFNTWLDAIDGSYCNFSAYGETGDGAIDPKYPDPRPGGYKGKLQCGVYEPTTVMSVSYGGQEADVPANYQKVRHFQQSTPESLLTQIQRQCLEYLKLGLQGSSILFASGDAGVGNYPAPYGFDNPETGCLGPTGRIFNRKSLTCVPRR
jgi:tripeptidyl-peptidase I